MRYLLHCTAMSAVSPAANRERGFLTPCLPYLPGGALRGALAAHWIVRFGQPEARLADRFASEVLALRIGPGIPLGGSVRPLSVYACKYPIERACRQVFDAAFSELPESGNCPGCEAKLDSSKGQWDSGAALRARTRTALGADGTVLQGSLFTRQYIARRQEFAATAEGDLRWLGTDSVDLRVGGQRSLAGAVKVKVLAAEPASISGGERLIVRLLSPGVFLSEDARNQLQPSSGDLARALRGTDMAGAQVRVKHAWARPDTVGGWNAAAGLPKSTEIAAAMGSTYVLQCAHGFSDDAAAAIAGSGLGVRRADGLGWVEVASAPWRPKQAEVRNASRAAPDRELQDIAHRIAELGGRGDAAHLRRRITRWLREEYTNEHLPPGYAYDGLPSQAKALVDDALAVTGDRRRALIIILAAASHASEGRDG